jgi:hypothetical protein
LIYSLTSRNNDSVVTLNFVSFFFIMYELQKNVYTYYSNKIVLKVENTLPNVLHIEKKTFWCVGSSTRPFFS